MSFIICSNDYDEENDSYSEINAPYSFTNILSNGGGLTIPKNAEVSVQSVKINKTEGVDVNPSFRFYLNFGEIISPDVTKELVTSYPIDIRPFLKPESLVSQEFIDRIEAEINKKLTHPMAFNQTVATIHYDSNGRFAGYKFNYTQTDIMSENGTENYSQGEILRYEQSGDLGFTYNDSLFELTSQPGFGSNQEEKHLRQCIFPNFALTGSPFHGNPGLTSEPFVVEGLSANQEWAVGLIRGGGSTPQLFPNYYDAENRPFDTHPDARHQGVYMTSAFYFDYVVCAVRHSSTSNRYLRVFEASVKRDYSSQEEALGDDKPFTLNEIKYWGSHSSVFETNLYNWSQNNSAYDSLSFYINGEYLGVSIGDDALVNLVSQETSDRENLFKPINQNCWCLYPKFYIQEDNQSILLATTPYVGAKISIDYSNNNIFYVDNVKQGLETQVCKELDTRYYNIIDQTRYDTYIPKILDKTPPWTNLFPDYIFTMIVGRTEDYFAPEADAGELLGFIKSIVDYTTDNSALANDGGFMISTDNPVGSQGNSLFVRLNNFTQQSFNAGNGGRSKIIYHLPKFDNTGRSIGDSLYYESSDRFYIKLNNSEEFIQSVFEIDLVDEHERVAYGQVEGKTVICLHIRESK